MTDWKYQVYTVLYRKLSGVLSIYMHWLSLYNQVFFLLCSTLIVWTNNIWIIVNNTYIIKGDTNKNLIRHWNPCNLIFNLCVCHFILSEIENTVLWLAKSLPSYLLGSPLKIKPPFVLYKDKTIFKHTMNQLEQQYKGKKY